MKNEIITIDELKVLLWDNKDLIHDKRTYEADLIFNEIGEVMKSRYNIESDYLNDIIERYYKYSDKPVPTTSLVTDKPKNKFLILASKKRK
jgi:hypothetical protein